LADNFLCFGSMPHIDGTSQKATLAGRRLTAQLRHSMMSAIRRTTAVSGVRDSQNVTQGGYRCMPILGPMNRFWSD
jgi:hypothetical protein